MLTDIRQSQAENPFLSVEEAATLAKSTPKSFYLYLCNSGAYGGEVRKRFPKHLYVKLGRRVLFIKQNLVEWLLNGARFEEGSTSNEKSI